ARLRPDRGSGGRLRRRDSHARAGGRAEVLRLVRGAAGRRARQARRARLGLGGAAPWVAGDAPELVLLHEGICDSRMWAPQWEKYAQSHRLMRLDFRGFGQTPLEPGPFASARDVLGLMDRHGFERAALVGVSLGGRVALEVAVAAPDRVSALILVGSGLHGHDWSKEMHAIWEAEEAALREGDLDGAVDVVLRTWVAGPGRELED